MTLFFNDSKWVTWQLVIALSSNKQSFVFCFPFFFFSYYLSIVLAKVSVLASYIYLPFFLFWIKLGTVKFIFLIVTNHLPVTYYSILEFLWWVSTNYRQYNIEAYKFDTFFINLIKRQIQYNNKKSNIWFDIKRSRANSPSLTSCNFFFSNFIGV